MLAMNKVLQNITYGPTDKANNIEATLLILCYLKYVKGLLQKIEWHSKMSSPCKIS